MKGFLGFILGGFGGAVIGIIIGLLIAQGLGFAQSGGTNIPYDTNHNSIGNSWAVQDGTWDKTLTRHHIQTGPIQLSPYAPQSTLFPAHMQLTQSLWTFTSGDDIDAILVICGPGTDGKTYLCSWSKVAGNAIWMHCSIDNSTMYWPVGASEWQTHDVVLP